MPSAAISLSPDFLSPRRPIRAKKGTYVIVRIHEATDRPSTEAFWQARVRIQDQPRARTPQIPSWHTAPLDSETKLRSELDSYVNLPDNWDGEGGAAPSQSAVDDALKFLDKRPADIPLPRPDQGSEGAVGIYWDDNEARVFAEATFEGDGTFAYFAAHGAPSAVADKCGSDDADVSAPWPDDLLRILHNLDIA